MSNSSRQTRFKQREAEGLGVLMVEVNLELVARTLNRLGYRVMEDRQDLARGVEKLLVDLAAQSIKRVTAVPDNALPINLRHVVASPAGQGPCANRSCGSARRRRREHGNRKTRPGMQTWALFDGWEKGHGPSKCSRISARSHIS
jgi:hypothetical protein